jgi:Family of unknown function (DUF6368)
MGPTVAIWLKSERTPSAEQLLSIAQSLDASAQSSTDINIRSTEPIGSSTVTPAYGSPFGFDFDDLGFTDDELKAVSAAFGFTPSSAIDIFAYANSPIDHRILAELALFFTRQFDGIVDFGGNLGSVSVRSGKLVSIPYTSVSGPSAFHVSDAEFLEAWLCDPGFHMIK